MVATSHDGVRHARSVTRDDGSGGATTTLVAPHPLTVHDLVGSGGVDSRDSHAPATVHGSELAHSYPPTTYTTRVMTPSTR